MTSPPTGAASGLATWPSRSTVSMGTVVTIIAPTATEAQLDAVADRAFAWFRAVEAACSRFDPNSELRGLLQYIGEPVKVSPLLFQAVRVALAVARASRGAFDPCIGAAMERQGFNRHYVTGAPISTPLTEAQPGSFRDIRLDGRRRTITLHKPTALDLGAVAKGFAIDLAARELLTLGSFSIEAGGDLYVAGDQQPGQPWRVGIQHPRREDALIETLAVRNLAVCTSGDYERRSPSDATQHHLLDPRTGRSSELVASVTVVAPTAIVADALSTAAFVMGPKRGLRLLERQGVEGLFVTADLNRHATIGFDRLVAAT